MSTKSHLLPLIPNVNDCLNILATIPEVQGIPRDRMKKLVRQFLAQIRKSIQADNDPGPLTLDEDGILPRLIQYVCDGHQYHFRKVVNATGVIIHTNLGRSLLPEATMESLFVAGSRYSNLEFDLATGKRGSRYSHIEDILCELTGAEAALVVNNNAAAVLIVLETLAKGKEAIVSRGQLVEIGGSFRIPDVMARSGATLVEVGATNRTHLADYQNALSQDTGVLLKVHCSNYRIIGFTSEVSNDALVALGHEFDIPVVEDLGSGSLIDLSRFGLEKEPTVQEAVSSGVDVVTFSGDKLLGGPQAGIIVGCKKYIEQIKKNPLNRALRIDKFTLSGLESILRCYLDEEKAIQQIPTLSMIAESTDQVQVRAEACVNNLKAKCKGLFQLDIVATTSRVGGGAMPEQGVESIAVAIQSESFSAGKLEKLLRGQPIPIIGRVEHERLLLDMRTVAEDEVVLIVDAMVAAIEKMKSVSGNI